MAVEPSGRRDAQVTNKRRVDWVIISLIVFAIAVAALGAWADSIGGDATPSATPVATASPVAP